VKNTCYAFSLLLLLVAASPCLGNPEESATEEIEQKLSAEDQEILDLLELLEMLELLNNMDDVAALEDNQ
jgi:hypothetical protein